MIELEKEWKGRCVRCLLDKERDAGVVGSNSQ